MRQAAVIAPDARKRQATGGGRISSRISTAETPAAGTTAGTHPAPLARLSVVVAALGSERLAAYRSIALWWAGSRALVLGAVLAVQAARWPRETWYPPLLEHPFALLVAWDGRWYRLVAERGYLLIPGHQSDPAFFPLYPVLMRGLDALGVPLNVGGLLLANLGFLVGLIALYELVRTWLPEPDARRAAVYAALFPIGFAFSMLYAEGVAFAAVALAGVFAARDRWLLAAAAAAAATLLRPQGLFLALPLAALALARWGRLSDYARGSALAAVAAAPVALASLGAYHAVHQGNPLAFNSAQEGWGRAFALDGAWSAVLELFDPPVFHGQWLWRDAAVGVFYLAALAVAARARVPPPWIVAGALMVLPPLWSGSFTSLARFGLLALPIYAGLAWLGRRRAIDLGIRAACVPLLIVSSMTILHHWP